MSKISKCTRCQVDVDFPVILPCNHYLCINCADDLISQNICKNCPTCNGQCDILAEIKPKYYYLAGLKNYGFNIGDTVWFYGGRKHNWLYNKEHCIKLNQAYSLYINQQTFSHTTEINISVNNNYQTYIIDFDNMCQYPNNNMDKKRQIGYFKLSYDNAFIDNNIAGISGQKI